MPLRWKLEATLMVCALSSMLFFCNACDGQVQYTPPFGLISFTISDTGVTFNADASIVTPVGDFNYQYPLASTSVDDGVLLVDIRYKKNGVITDSVYKIHTDNDEVIVTTNGHTVIDISNHHVLIDASSGGVQTVEVRDKRSGSTAVAPAPTQVLYKISWNKSHDSYLYTYGDDQRPASGDHFVVVNVTIHNLTDQAQSFPFKPTFNLHSEGDNQDWAVAKFMQTTLTIQPQDTVTMDIVFVVPNDTCGSRFSVTAFGSSSNWTDKGCSSYTLSWNRSYDSLSYVYNGVREWPTPGNHFIIVNVTINNVTNDTQSFDPHAEFQLHSDGDDKNWNIANFMPSSMAIQPQDAVTADIVFVVPNDTCLHSYTISALGSSNGWTDQGC